MSGATELRTFRKHPDFEAELGASSFRCLIDSLSGNQATYIKYYRFGQLRDGLTFDEYRGRVQALAAHLAVSANIEKGCRVVLVVDNKLQALLCYGALLYLGAVLVPVDPSLPLGEIEKIQRKVRARLAMTDKARGLNDEWVLSENHFQAAPSVRRLGTTALGDPAAIFFTSGTTGHSKGAVLSVGNLLINAAATQRLHAMQPQHVHMNVLPVFHVNGFHFSFVSTLYSGSKLILQQNFFPFTFWKDSAENKVDVASLVPTLLQVLCQDKRVHACPEFPRYVVTAASPLSARQAAAFQAKFHVRLIQSYGLSEAVNFSLSMPPTGGSPEQDASVNRPPSVGTPVFGNEVAVLDVQTGKRLGENEIGELVVRGFNVMQGYLDDPDATDKVFKWGWLHTGDLGFFETVNGEPYFYVTGRIKEMLKRAGENIPLGELDDVLRSQAGLEDSVTVAFPNEHTGEEVGLFVVPQDDTPATEEILRMCRTLLSKTKAPKVVVLGEKIPRSATGKTQRQKLAVHFSAYQEVLF